MNTNTNCADTHQVRWARFRFSIIGPLLAAPPECGELKSILEDLSKRTWRNPITDQPLVLVSQHLNAGFIKQEKIMIR